MPLIISNCFYLSGIKEQLKTKRTLGQLCSKGLLSFNGLNDKEF